MFLIAFPQPPEPPNSSSETDLSEEILRWENEGGMIPECCPQFQRFKNSESNDSDD